MKISEIIDLERIAIDVPLASKKAVLEKLAEMLAAADSRVNAQQVFDSLLARERLGTTGLGAGIAIPHGRAATNEVSIGAFMRTAAPIDFDAVDNAPVDLFFALCVPENANEEHLQLLAQLAARFSSNEFVAALRASEKPAEILAQLATDVTEG